MFTTATLVLASLGFSIRGTSDCPSLDDVRARLSEMVMLAEAPRVEERAVVERREGTVHVALESANGQVIGERELAASGSCQELAQVVAVVLAAWLGDTHPELVARLPEPSAPPSADPPPSPAASSAAPAPAPAKVPEPRAPRASRVEAPLEHDGGSPERRRLVSSAALGSSVGRYGAVPGVQVGVAWLSRDSGFGWALSAGISGERERTLGDGLVRWSRWPLTAGPVLRITSERLALELQAGPAVAWLRLAGSGFLGSAPHQDITYGAMAAVRLGWRASVLEPFIGVSPYFWLRPATAFVSGPAPLELTLPATEMWFVAGVAVAPLPRKPR
jgi:hypothetical protein